MKKKILVLLSTIFVGMILMFGITKTYAADEPTYPCKVVQSLSDGGDVVFDVEEGNVGDVVTAYVKADFLFSVSSVQVNGTALELTKDGIYTFELIDGDNIFSVEFTVDNEKLAEVLTLVENVKQNGISSLFTMSNLLNLIQWIITALLSSGFLFTLIKTKKLKAKTVEEVYSATEKAIQNVNATTMKEFLNVTVEKTLEVVNDKIGGLDECMKVLCRCFILMQDDKPESKLAIVEELTNLANNDEALTNKIKEILNQEKLQLEQRIVERNEAIKELKENNEKLIVDNSGDSYGQL